MLTYLDVFKMVGQLKKHIHPMEYQILGDFDGGDVQIFRTWTKNNL